MSTESLTDDVDPVITEPMPRRKPHPISRTLLWLVVVGFVGFALWRLLGSEHHWLAVTTMSFTPYVMFAGIIPVVWSLVSRAGIAFTVVVLSILALAAVVVPRMISTQAPDVDGPKLTVMTVNLRVGGGDTGQVMDLVDQHEVDVLSVQELTDEALDGLNESGLTERFPHQEFKASTDASGTGIFSRLPITVLSPVPGRFFMPTVRLDLTESEGDGQRVEFTAVHPTAPISGDHIADWRADIEALPGATLNGPIRILAGDFNASLDHRILRDLIGTGYHDAASATGNGMVGTWQPVGAISGLIPPVALDRVLSDERTAIRNFSTHPITGSDHLAVVTVIQLPE
ncbi:endonuclease/exonuclease/phosphatase (EEP) superfamily protein YafD [Stackebrandtia endophytica]|uniref:Endonuclease/exonuclease/phosphatase (EEP) superfamily protein YafD n=1 Tax=Stackebrandtia endophytica TaxID=1496996 RepID=A0A543AUY3_9ACTN|nr:endonuclease/exonuclease/phosphatase family protein [Stackebrandtia endophytica]TQL76357.1 endonuclease/exonuclease/phosphatase (EEP) superfamily protein YafD [Stackebrandtia endophytica]